MFVTGSRNRWDWLLGATVLSLVVAYVFYWADGIMYGPRYYFEAVGILALLFGLAHVGTAAAEGPPVPGSADQTNSNSASRTSPACSTNRSAASPRRWRRRRRISTRG